MANSRCVDQWWRLIWTNSDMRVQLGVRPLRTIKSIFIYYRSTRLQCSCTSLHRWPSTLLNATMGTVTRANDDFDNTFVTSVSVVSSVLRSTTRFKFIVIFALFYLVNRVLVNAWPSKWWRISRWLAFDTVAVILVNQHSCHWRVLKFMDS